MRTKRSIYNLFFNIFSLVITFAMGIVIPKLFIVNLGSEANGLVSSVGQIFSYVSLLEAGIGATAIQALYKPIAEKNKDRINQILSASERYYKKIGVIYIGCIIIIALIYPAVVRVQLPIWQVVGVVVLSGLGNAINFLLQQNYVVLLSAEGKGYVTTNLNLVVNVAISLTKAFLLMQGYNIVVILGATFMLGLCRILLMRVYMARHYQWLNMRTKPDFSALSKQRYVLTQQLSYFIYCNTDVVILTFCGDLKLVSVYTLYNTIIGVMEGVVGAFTSSIVFALGQLYHEDFMKFKKTFQLFDAFYTTVVFALFSVVYLCMTPFLTIYTRGIVDANYIDQTLVFLFVILKMVTTLRSQSQNVVGCAGRFQETQRSSIVEAILNIVVSVVGVYYLGIYGVLMGSIISSFYKGIVISNYCNNNIIMLTTREKLIRSMRWVMYILTFGFVSIIAPRFLPNTVDNYVQWIGLAISSTLIMCSIYFLLFVLSDFKMTKETLKMLSIFRAKKR